MKVPQNGTSKTTKKALRIKLPNVSLGIFQIKPVIPAAFPPNNLKKRKLVLGWRLHRTKVSNNSPFLCSLICLFLSLFTKISSSDPWELRIIFIEVVDAWIVCQIESFLKTCSCKQFDLWSAVRDKRHFYMLCNSFKVYGNE